MRKKITCLLLLSLSIYGCNENKKSKHLVVKSNNKDTVKHELVSKPSTIIKLYQANVLGPWEGYCTSKFLLSINTTSVKAIGFDCSDEYGLFNYYDGNISKNAISGSVIFFDNCGGSDDSTPMCVRNDKFKFVFSKDTNQITINGDIYKAKNLTISNSNFDLYETPSKNSKIIFKNKEKSSVQVLEIGNIERVDKLWKVWSKISVNGKTGWFLGGLSI